MNKEPKYWVGSQHLTCDLCGADLVDGGFFIDGRIYAHTTWAMMCLLCHNQVGVGLGTGRGQKYERQEDGKWLKIGG